MEYSGTQSSNWKNVSFSCVLQVSKQNPKNNCRESRYSEEDTEVDTQSFLQPRILLPIVAVTMYIKKYREDSTHSI